MGEAVPRRRLSSAVRRAGVIRKAITFVLLVLLVIVCIPLWVLTWLIDELNGDHS